LSPDTSLSVVRVKSGRIARKRTRESAKNYIERLKREPIETQRLRLLNTWIKIAPSNYKILKVQNLRLFREVSQERYIPLFTTINKNYAENVALHYSQSLNKKSFLRKTKTSYVKLPLDTPDDNLNKI
jgi:hypothetical protein